MRVFLQKDRSNEDRSKERGVQQLRIVDIKIPKSSSSLTTILIITLRVVGDIYIPIPGTYLHGNYTRSRLSPFLGYIHSSSSALPGPFHRVLLLPAYFTLCVCHLCIMQCSPHAPFLMHPASFTRICTFHSCLHLSLMSASFTHVLSAPYISGNYS